MKLLYTLLEKIRSSNDSSGEVELVSVHIPKTAGTSFRFLLKDVYGDAAVARVDLPLNSKRLKVNEQLQATATLPNNTQVVHGHFVAKELYEYFPQFSSLPLITWLRHPVDRVISNYNYLAKRLAEELDEEGKGLNILSKMQRSLMEYAQAEINRNRQTKFLNGSQLEDFTFVGIQEFYKEDVADLARELGWTSWDIPVLNVTGKKKSGAVSDQVRAEIAALNAEDMQLYEQALELRNQRKSQPKAALISIHIPKTGGTSFYKQLSNQYGKELAPSLKRKDINSLLNRDGSLAPFLNGNRKVLHGHFHYNEVADLCQQADAKAICWLRDPVERVISNYQFFQAGLKNPGRNPEQYAHNKHRKKESLLTYANRPENQNTMLKFLNGIALEDLFFIGFLEQFEHDINYLAELLGWDSVVHTKLNQSQQKELVSEDLRAQLAILNAKDIALYEHAKKIRGIQ